MPQEFHELLTESFKEVDIEDQDYITFISSGAFSMSWWRTR